MDDFTPFRNIINEWYAKDTSKKVRAVKKAKGMAGEHLSSYPPYGYIKDPENPKEWIIDEEAADVVREIFGLCIQGYGPMQIARKLTERKILTPAAYAVYKGRRRPGSRGSDPYRWGSSVVVNILERIEYLGHTVNFKTHKTSYKTRKQVVNPPEDRKLFENTQEPIIDQATFDAVQRIRHGRRRITRLGEMPMLSGMLFCADCGSRMAALHRKGGDSSHDGFLCGAYNTDSSVCSTHYIRYSVIERLILDNLRELTKFVSDYEDEFVRVVVDMDMKEKNKQLAKKKRQLKEKQARINELDDIFQKIYEDNLNGKLSDERFANLFQRYENEQNTLKNEVKELQSAFQKDQSESANVEKFIACVRKYTDLPELTPEILHEFIDKVIVHASDKSSGKRLQEIEIVYNHIGVINNSKITV